MSGEHAPRADYLAPLHTVPPSRQTSAVPRSAAGEFDFSFNKKLNRSLVCELASAGFIAKHEAALFLGPAGTRKSYLAQAIGLAAIRQNYRVLYRQTHTLLDEIAEAT